MTCVDRLLVCCGGRSAQLVGLDIVFRKRGCLGSHVEPGQLQGWIDEFQCIKISDAEHWQLKGWIDGPQCIKTTESEVTGNEF